MPPSAPGRRHRPSGTEPRNRAACYIEPTKSQSWAIVVGSVTGVPVAAPELSGVVLAVVSVDVPVVVPVVPVVPLVLAVVSLEAPAVPPLPVVGIVVEPEAEAVCIVLQSCSTWACCSGVRFGQAERMSVPLFSCVIALSVKNASAIAPLQFAVVLFSASLICSMPGEAAVLPDVVADVPELAPEVVSLVPELVCAIAVEAMARDTAAARMSLCFIWDSFLGGIFTRACLAPFPNRSGTGRFPPKRCR